MPAYSLTPEQQAIIAHVRDTDQPLIIDAKAGTGKTSTLLEMLPALRGTTTIQAFNKSIAEEIKAKAAGLPFEVQINLDIRTVHSHGLAAFKGRKPNVTGGKVSFILKDLLKAETFPDDPIWKHTSLVAKLVGLAKSSGFGLVSSAEPFPDIRDEEAWREMAEHFGTLDDLNGDEDLEADAIRYARKALLLSNQRLGQVDFDDMIYLPLLHNLPLATYDNVLLDEAQDINATRREMAFRSLKPGGRVIAVGDPNQAIYGFTGASASALDDIRARNHAPTLPLSICWRCDAAIIEEAQAYVPGIKARPNAGPGLVRTVDWTEAPDGDWLASVRPGDAILCRLNKPNVAVALGLLRRGLPARIEGRDLGERLLSHMKKAEPRYAFVSMDELSAALDNYGEEQERILLNKMRESAAALLIDEVDAAKLMLERAEELRPRANFTDVEALVANLFQNDVPRSQFITLSSIHKSKGREWPRVWLLGKSDYMPFFKAAEGWQMDQEFNLIYVAITRAERELIYVEGVKSAIDKGLHRKVASPPAPIGVQPAAKPAAETPAQPTVDPLAGLDLSNINL